jgi:hypothetical protein
MGSGRPLPGASIGWPERRSCPGCSGSSPLKPAGDSSAARGKGIPGLREAVEREREAASRLASELGQAREAARRLDVDGLGALLGRARRAADDLARAGGQRMRLGEGLARTLAVATDTPLDRLMVLAGPSEGLPEAVGALGESLRAVARESSALGICTRYGGAVAGHLAAFAAGGACYGPRGRLSADPRAAGRRA